MVKRKVLPTYGVSFGLPYPNNHHGGYPPNALGDYYPAQNPYFGSIGPDGLNLGLINVNPLVSVQVQKTEFGDKVVKPLVNLHVTPNANIFEKFGSLFKTKDAVIQNHHYHHHDHYTGFEHDHHHEHHPEIISGPIHYSSPPTGSGHGHYHHDHHPEIVTGPGPIHHYSSPPTSFKHYDVEMYSSKPIFEYHSGPQIAPPPVHPIPSPLHHHEEHHHSEQYEEHHSNHASSFASHASPSYPASGSDGHTSFGSHTSSYQPSGSGFGTSGAYPPSGQSQGYSTGYGNTGYDATGGDSEGIYDRSSQVNKSLIFAESQRYRKGKALQYPNKTHSIPTQAPGAAEGSNYVTFPKDRRRRSAVEQHESAGEERSSVLAETVKLEKVLGRDIEKQEIL